MASLPKLLGSCSSPEMVRLLSRLKSVDWARAVFWLVIAFGVFLAGGVFATKRLQPYLMFEDGYRAAKALIEQAVQPRHDLIERIQYQGEGLVYSDPAKAYDGLTLIEGLFPEGVELRLLDMNGDVVNRWPVHFFEIWPEPTHVPEETVPATDLNYHTHGIWLLPDGSVVFNISSYGTVKMDKCGKVLWKVDEASHHTITPNPDGSFWIPIRGHPDEIPDRLKLRDIDRRSPHQLVRYEDRMLLVSADGIVQEEISVLNALFEGEFENALFDGWEIKWSDPTHINDIEVVTPELAERIDGVDAGDLLVSIRQSHTLAIIGRNNGRIKWTQTGPWVRQHDPDITAEGYIEVFDNGGEHKPPERLRSRIVTLDPADDRTWTLYPLSDGTRFFSRIMGAHQRLPNGNRLISETMAGRVFEVTDSGEVVWDYIVPYDDEYAALIETAIRYDPGYLTVQDWNCPAASESAGE